MQTSPFWREMGSQSQTVMPLIPADRESVLKHNLAVLLVKRSVSAPLDQIRLKLFSLAHSDSETHSFAGLLGGVGRQRPCGMIPASRASSSRKLRRPNACRQCTARLLGSSFLERAETPTWGRRVPEPGVVIIGVSPPFALKQKLWR